MTDEQKDEKRRQIMIVSQVVYKALMTDPLSRPSVDDVAEGVTTIIEASRKVNTKYNL